MPTVSRLVEPCASKELPRTPIDCEIIRFYLVLFNVGDFLTLNDRMMGDFYFFFDLGDTSCSKFESSDDDVLLS